MENPYWRTAGQSHHIDLEAIRTLCFDLSNIIGGSSELVGRLEFSEDPKEEAGSSLLRLHYEMAEPRISKILLQLAILVRTYDDIMRSTQDSTAYLAHTAATQGANYIGNLGGQPLSLREACNKIIHASEVRPAYERVDHSDAGVDDPPLGWHLSGEVELAGTQGRASWEALLFVLPFLETILDRIAFSLENAA